MRWPRFVRSSSAAGSQDQCFDTILLIAETRVGEDMLSNLLHRDLHGGEVAPRCNNRVITLPYLTQLMLCSHIHATCLAVAPYLFLLFYVRKK